MKYQIKDRVVIQKKIYKRKRRYGRGRPFKLEVKNKFLMFLEYYHLYITFTLDGFIFDVEKSNICRDIQKIKLDEKMCVYPTKDI
jgi:hypothetical protein